MRHGFVVLTAFFLLSSHYSAYGDATTKGQMLDEFLTIKEFSGEDPAEIVHNTPKEIIQNDIRIKPQDKARFAEQLEKTLDKNEVIKRKRQLWDFYFTEDEIKYVFNLSKSAIGVKWVTTMPVMEQQIFDLVTARLKKNYQKVTGLPYQESASPKERVKVEPNWLTKLVWKFYPDQKDACECQ